MKSGTIDGDEFTQLCYDMGYAIPTGQRAAVLALLAGTGAAESFEIRPQVDVRFKEFFRWWKEHKDKFFISSYTPDITAAIYYFKKFDHALSGSLDRVEYAAMCTEMGWDSADIDDSMQYLDSDGSGTVFFNTFVTWYTDDGMVNNLIRTYDVDKNGKLNLPEFTEMCKQWRLDPAKAVLILRKFDKDGDGELGLEDMKGLIAKINKPPA